MNRLIISLVLSYSCTLAFPSNEVPGKPQSRPIALVGGTIDPIVGDPITDGTILFNEGKIVAIGRNLKLPANTETIDVRGKRVYPSLIDAYTQLGLVEIDSVRATIDSRELGSLNPNVKSWVAVNPDSELIPVTRANGVFLVLTAPTGGLISGRSAVLQLDGWTTEDLVLRADVGMHVNWPSMRGRAASAESPLKPLHDLLKRTKEYQVARQGNPDRHGIDARLEGMLSVLDRSLPLIVTANEMREIQGAVGFAMEHKLRLIIHGGYDAPQCAELLKKHEIPVIVSGTYRLPMYPEDSYDAPYTLPQRLHEAGVTYCLASIGRFGGTGVRNLPYHAATAAAFGLPLPEALKSITIHSAKVLGIDDRVGSLEVGKDATLFVATGDPLEVDCTVESAFVQGRKVELNDRHKRLWEKYQKKYQPARTASE
jgi:imidazolonepropionase-like amidohydrolase